MKRPSTSLGTGREGARIEAALIAALRALPPGTAGDRTALRGAIGCGAGALRQAIDRLRYQGKLLWDRLELAGSMRADDFPSVQETVASVSKPARAVNLPQTEDPGAAGIGPAGEDGAGCEEGGAELGNAPAPPSEHDEAEQSSAPSVATPLSVTDGGVADDAAAGALAHLPEPAPAAAYAVPDAPVDARVLEAEIMAWLRGLPQERRPGETMFGKHLCNDPSFLNRLRRTAAVRPATAAKVRAFLAAHPDGVVKRARGGKAAARRDPSALLANVAANPDGLPAPAQVRAEEARRPVEASPPRADLLTREPFESEAEAEVRRRAEFVGPRKRIPLPADLSPVESLQTALAETPGDLIRAIQRRHEQLWNRIILLGRAREERPGLAMQAVLEAGLKQLEQQSEVRTRT